jgi:hypothetical protein
MEAPILSEALKLDIDWNLVERVINAGREDVAKNYIEARVQKALEE